MARIPDEALECLKREVSLARLIEAQGVKLISQGKDLACRCPWHEGDDTPSCIVSPKTNLWHCFGCDAGGSCVIHAMSVHCFTACRSSVSRDAGHRFHAMSVQHFTACRSSS